MAWPGGRAALCLGRHKRLERGSCPADSRLARHRLCWARPTTDIWRGDLIVYVRSPVGLRMQSTQAKSPLVFQPLNPSSTLGCFPAGQYGTHATCIADQRLRGALLP